MAPKLPMLDPTVVRAVSKVLTESEGGLTNADIDEVFSALGMQPPPRGTKRYRVSETLLAEQNRTLAGNAVIRFVAETMNPARYLGKERRRFFVLQSAVNDGLLPSWDCASTTRAGWRRGR
jgi:hypothetical protein